VFNKDVKVPLQEAELVGTSSSNTYGFVSCGGDMDEFNELDTQDHVINGDTNNFFGRSPTGSIG
jgi:hypothetical protein